MDAKKAIKNIIKKIIPRKLWNTLLLRDVGAYKTCRFLNKEQKKSFKKLVNSEGFWKENTLDGGVEYPEITFYVIRRDCRYLGLFSIFITNIGHIRYAIDKGYVPVIDMKNYKNNYHKNPLEVGKVNTWECYFQQPTKYSLEEAYSGKNIILCDAELLNVRYPTESTALFNNENHTLDGWKKYAQLYMKIREDLLSEIKSEWTGLVGNSRVLGIFLRGTDYVRLRPPLHPIQPDVETVIKDIKDIIDGYGKLFVATEDIGIFNRLKEEFGEKCITNKREFVKYSKGNTPTIHINRENDSYLQGKEYLTNIVMLSMCDGIIASRAGGSVGAAILSTAWDYSKFYDLGRYPLQ